MAWYLINIEKEQIELLGLIIVFEKRTLPYIRADVILFCRCD
jgi:hypothetical protein